MFLILHVPSCGCQYFLFSLTLIKRNDLLFSEMCRSPWLFITVAWNLPDFYLFLGFACKGFPGAAAKLRQSYLTLCDPTDGSPTGSSVPGILQARIWEWVAISFSIAWKWKVKVKLLSRVQFLATPWTAAHQAPPSVGFSRQEYWSGAPLLPWWLSAKKSTYVCSRQQVLSLSRQDPLEEEVAISSSILAWEIPWTEKPAGVLMSMGLQRVRHNLATEQEQGFHVANTRILP